MWERIKRILIKEFLQTLRDPKMKAILIVVPVLQSIIFGYAVTTDVREVALAIMDHDNTPESRAFLSRFTSSGYFRVAHRVSSVREVRYLLDRESVKGALEIDSGVGNTVSSGRTAAVQMIVDGTDSNSAGVVLNYAGRVVQGYNLSVLSGSGRALSQPVELRTRAWFNENLTSRNFYVPGVIALLLALITLMLSSMAIVREKEIGTMEQIIVTPITRIEFILGKMVPFAILGMADVFVITGICLYWFEVPMRGSFLLLLVSAALFLMSTLGLGLLISTMSSTQQQAMMSTFFIFFPAILLSGFLFPISNMPAWIQAITYVNPLRYILIIIRGIFLKGIGLSILWPELLSLFCSACSASSSPPAASKKVSRNAGPRRQRMSGPSRKFICYPIGIGDVAGSAAGEVAGKNRSCRACRLHCGLDP
jgi:ABC-2 type transport system permease protein